MYCSPAFNSIEYTWPLPTRAIRPRPVTSELPQFVTLYTGILDVQIHKDDSEAHTKFVLILGLMFKECPVHASNARL